MKPDDRLLFGPLAAAVLAVGIAALPFWVPGYNHVQQTVSEIGEMDSPARVPFTIVLCTVAICLLIFAAGMAAASKRALWAEMKPVYGLVQRSLFAAWFGWCAGIGVLLRQHRRASP
jgi:hypothetical protein